MYVKLWVVGKEEKVIYVGLNSIKLNLLSDFSFFFGGVELNTLVGNL